MPHLRASYYSDESGITVGSSNKPGINVCYPNCIRNRPLGESPREKQCNCMKECNDGNVHCTGEGKTATTPEQRGVSRKYVECAKLCNVDDQACEDKCQEEEEAENPPPVHISDMDLSAM